MNQGEIWLINLDPTVGAEIKKTRPAIIVNDDALGKLPLKIIVPVTDWKDRYEIAPWMTKIEPDKDNGLNKISAVDNFQIRSVSQGRFVKQIGSVSETIMDEIRNGLAKVLSIDSE
ncbi:MAG: type II toxin-antitoxin system PemK/MazF family toxin [Balneolaceae bacterium]|nr:MAG: type II toxin-antitoxin system PemK/MazF family toxin [Balneolaceae bacterium]